MDKITSETRLNQIPVLYVKGTHHVVGFAIGRQCKSMIADVVDNWQFFNEVVIEKFLTPEGKEIYDGCLSLCMKKFPQYVEELKGMAEGAGVPFYKLFLLHIDSLIIDPELEDKYEKQKGQTGCTTVMSNSDEVIIGHTEDACPEFLNNVFVVCAHVVSANSGETLEKFSTLTYAGYLPGYTMGYNHHGMIYTVNTIFPKVTLCDRTPRHFIARSLLRASNLHQVIDILQDVGNGCSDGFSLNLHFAKQEGTPVLHNVEIGPCKSQNESELSVLNLTHGEHHVHCNRYLRLKIDELSGVAMESSKHRHKAIGRHLVPNNIEKIRNILSDQSDTNYPVFRRGNKLDYVKTVAAGIFDVNNRKWYIYADAPSESSPVATLSIDI